MIDVRINRSFGPYTEGQVVKVDVKDGVPTDTYWRRRLKDAQLDGCCEVVKPKAKPTKRAAQESEKE